ncbi:hypothetical protein LNP25_31750 [Klebsiella variicola subsp. variicola]|nr:hypothetical protein [Klebsiella variicola subsp. variicola]
MSALRSPSCGTRALRRRGGLRRRLGAGCGEAVALLVGNPGADAGEMTEHSNYSHVCPLIAVPTAGHRVRNYQRDGDY